MKFNMINYFLRKSRQTNPIQIWYMKRWGLYQKFYWISGFLLRLVKKLSDYDDGEAIGTSGWIAYKYIFVFSFVRKVRRT